MSKNNPLISIVIPFFNERDNLEWHHKKMSNFLKESGINHEFIYVDDGSDDESLDIIKSLAINDSSIHYVSFSRNFGKEAATTAGLKAAKGDAVVMIDSDGQHPIELVKIFLLEWKKGYMQVIGIREEDGEKRIIKRVGSRAFYFILKFLGANNSSSHGLTDFRLIDRRIVDEYNRLSEHNRVTRNLLDWLGFSRTLVAFSAEERHAGQASYSMRKLIKLAIDGVVKHSTRPLKFIGVMGILISLFTAIFGMFIVIEQYMLGDPMRLHFSGSATLAVFTSFMIGVVLVCQGLLALYIENVYYETQNRPLYVVREEK